MTKPLPNSPHLKYGPISKLRAVSPPTNAGFDDCETGKPALKLVVDEFAKPKGGLTFITTKNVLRHAG